MKMIRLSRIVFRVLSQACIYFTIFQLSPDSNNKIHTTARVIFVD